MVILYGHMSKCECLPRHTALEDIWLALDMLPRFRWRWERKDVNGGHPLIAKLAERVMDVNLHTIGPATHPVLLSEPEWDGSSSAEENMLSPAMKAQQTTPTLTAATYNNANSSNGGVYGPPQQRAMNGSNNGHAGGGSTPPDKHLLEVPQALFFPFYPEAQVNVAQHQGQGQNGNGGGGNGSGNGNHQQDYNALLAAAAAQPTHETYMSEERDGGQQTMGGPMWMNVVR